MPAPHRVLDVVDTLRGWIAVVLMGCLLTPAERPGTTAVPAPSTRTVTPAATPSPGPEAAPAGGVATDCARTMPADGQGGCHAIVALWGKCQEPVSSLHERYGLLIASRPQRGTTMELDAFRSWHNGDRFLAQLRLVRSAKRAGAAPPSPDCPCDAREDDGLAVVGLFPLDPEDDRSVAQITATKPDLWSPSDHRWGARRPERERWTVEVTPDRRWQVPWIDPYGPRVDVKRLGPVPATATVGSVHVFVGSPGTRMRPLRSTAVDGAPPGPVISSQGLVSCELR